MPFYIQGRAATSKTATVGNTSVPKLSRSKKRAYFFIQRNRKTTDHLAMPELQHAAWQQQQRPLERTSHKVPMQDNQGPSKKNNWTFIIRFDNVYEVPTCLCKMTKLSPESTTHHCSSMLHEILNSWKHIKCLETLTTIVQMSHGDKNAKYQILCFHTFPCYALSVLHSLFHAHYTVVESCCWFCVFGHVHENPTLGPKDGVTRGQDVEKGVLHRKQPTRKAHQTTKT